MAKKPLKEPSVPPGDRRAFFKRMQSLVTEAGDLPTAEVGKRVGYSHQAVYKALTGPNMPSEQITTAIAQALGGSAVVGEMQNLWRHGVSEQREVAAQGATSSPAETVLPELSPREIEVMTAWILADSKPEVSRKLFISPGTINTHLARIRDKYRAAGRSAPTKAGLLARALQDGLISIDDL